LRTFFTVGSDSPAPTSLHYVAELTRTAAEATEAMEAMEAKQGRKPLFDLRQGVQVSSDGVLLAESLTIVALTCSLSDGDNPILTFVKTK
jgi:hypothetical protein